MFIFDLKIWLIDWSSICYRLTKKERKSTMVDELLADAEFKKYNKRKYVEIIESQQRKVRHGGYSGKKKKT